MAYEAGLEKDPSSDVLKKGMGEVKKAMENDVESPFGPGGDMGLGRLFKDPGLMAKLEANPKTKGYMQDPSFRSRVAALQAGAKGMEVQSMLSDPRMLTVMGVAMGIDIVSWRIHEGYQAHLAFQDAMERPEGSEEMPPGMGGSSAGASQSFPSEPTTSSTSSQPKAEAKPKPKETEPESEAETMEVDSEDAGQKKEAEDLKAKGNTAYKARKFDEAIEAYQKAWELYPKDITFLTNLSGEVLGAVCAI